MARKALVAFHNRLAILVLLAGVPGIVLRLLAANAERERIGTLLTPGATPRPDLIAAVNEGMTRDLLVMSGATLLCAVVAWGLGYFMVRRRALRLAKRAQKIVGISEATLPDGKPTDGEFDLLARSLEALGKATQDRSGQQESALRSQEALLESLPDVPYVYSANPQDPQYRPYVSGGIEALTGYTPQEWLADPKMWSRSLHRDDRERVLADYERSCKTGERFDCEYRLAGKDGKTRWVHDRAAITNDAEGKTILMRGMMADVTARKEVSEKLEFGLARLDTALLSHSDAIVGLDHHQTVTMFNVAAERLFRVEKEAVVGRHISELFEDDPYIAPDIRLDLHGKRGDGTIFIADTVISYTESGDEGLYLLALREATELRSESERLRSSEINFRRMFVSHPFPMWLYDVQTLRFIEVNDAAVGHYGYTREEFLAMRVTDLRASENVPRLVPSNSGKLQDPQRTIQSRHQRKDGQMIDVQLISSEWEHEGRAAVLVVAEDVTERKLAEEALKESERRFRAFFEGTAIGVALVDMDGRIVKSNPAFHDLLGYSVEELRGASFDSLRHPGDGFSIPNPLDELVGAKTDHMRTEWRFSRKDGRVMEAHLTASVVRGAKQQPQFCIYMVEDITERKRSQEQIRRQVDRLAALRNVDMAISGSLDLRVTLSVILDEVVKQLKVDAADVLLLNPHNQALEYAAGRGFRNEGISRSRVRLGEGYAGRAAMYRSTHSVSNITDSGDLSRAPLLIGEDFVSYTAVPLTAKGQVKGVLEVFHRSAYEPDREWLQFLEALAGQAAIAIDNASMFYDLQRSNVELTLAYDVTLEGWSRALDLRDRETEGHTQRVTEMTMRLARHIGMDEGELIHIHRGSLLHDIGKMGIPDAILLKTGPLTREEWDTMRLHPVYAHELLSPISFLRPAIEIPYCHHEKWDGTGYPRGLKGEQIPLAARIFAVVDVWDALRSDRPYRKAWPEGKVREHIRSLAGTHFDPSVVAAFMQLEPPPQPYHPPTVPLEGLLELIERRKAEEGLPEVPWATERTVSRI